MAILWGQNQYATIPYSTTLNTVSTNLSIMCRVNMTVSQALSMFISRQVSATPQNEWWALTMVSGAPRALIGNGTGVSAAQASVALTVGVPYWLMMTYDGTTINLYQDTVLVATTVVAIAIATDTTPIIINGNANAAGNTNIIEFFSGTVEDLRVYNRTLSLPEMQTIYNANGQDNIVNGLVLHYKMNEGANGSAMAINDKIKDYGYAQQDATVTLGSPTYSTILSQSRKPIRC